MLPILAVVAGLTTLLAVWAIGSRVANSSRGLQSSMFPELSTMANAVQAIELLHDEQRIRLERGSDGVWVLASRDNYPAAVDRVRDLLGGLTNLQQDQALTTKPERHQELNLAWPDPEHRARIVRLFTSAEGAPLEVIIGQERMTPRSTYVRRLPEAQVWRCRGGVNFDIEAGQWMRRDLLSLPSTEFLGATWLGMSVTPRPMSQEPPTQRSPEMFQTTSDGSTPWSAAQMAASRSVLGEWPARLEFSDVRAAHKDFVPSADRTISFHVKGALLVMEGQHEGDTTWFRLRVEPKTGGSPPTKEHEIGDPWIPDWNQFAKSVAGWEFQLPAWREAQLTRLRTDKPEPEAPPRPDMKGRTPQPLSSTVQPAPN